jgi:hypothetical protein
MVQHFGMRPGCTASQTALSRQGDQDLNLDKPFGHGECFDADPGTSATLGRSRAIEAFVNT